MIDPFTQSVQAQAVNDVASRVVGINETTRRDIAKVITDSLDESVTMTSKDISSAIRDLHSFNEARAELIARTETQFAYNRAALTSYGHYGVEQVQAIDGDNDAVCMARNGQTFSVDEASGIEDHPNGTLDWLPIRGQRAAAAEPPPAPAPFDAAMTISRGPVKPVSSAFDNVIAKVESNTLAARDPRYRAVTDKIKTALNRIDRTFRDGNLPEMPNIGPIINGPAGLQGQYGFAPTGSRLPVHLEFRAKANIETVFHEISHFIDHHGIGTGELFGSKLGFARARGELDKLLAELRRRIATERSIGNVVPGSQRALEIAALERQLADAAIRAEVMEPVAQAILNSQGYRALTQALADGRIEYLQPGPGGVVSRVLTLDRGSQRWVTYARDPSEVFARAMAQYLSKREGGLAVRQIEERLYFEGTRHVRPLADQWDWDDFNEIDDAITGMLDRIGWLVR